MRPRADEAVATLPAFLAATAIFAIAFASVTYFASDYISKHQNEGPALDSVAASAIAALIGTPGSPSDWETRSVTSMDRWGLLKPGSETTISGEKVIAIHRWGDDWSRYALAKAAIGLEHNNMRIRIYPQFPSGDNGVPALSNIRTAFVGATEADGDLTGGAIVEATSLDATGAEFENLENDHDLDLAFTAGDLYRDSREQITENLVPRLAGFVAAEDKIQSTSPDGYWKVVNLSTYRSGACEGALAPDNDRVEGVAPTPPATSMVLTMGHCASTSWTYGATAAGAALVDEDRLIVVEVDLTGLDGVGGDGATLTLKQYVDGYTALGSFNVALDDYGVIQYLCLENCGGAGLVWTTIEGNDGYALDGTGSAAAFDTTEYPLDDLAGKRFYLALAWHAFQDVPTEASGEGWFISNATVTVQTDGAQSWAWYNPLNFTNSNYDALVIGSDTAHARFADVDDPTFEQAVKQWVDEGGDLLLTGNNLPDTTWLPSWSAAGSPSPVNGPFFQDRTDALHAILNTPYRLRHTTYTPSMQSFTLSGAYFNTVVVREFTQGGTAIPLLSVSGGSAPFKGTAVFTAYRPVDLGAVEGEYFYSNALIFMHYHDLVLDYGATVPRSLKPGGGVDTVMVEVGSATRSTVLDASVLDLSSMEAQVVVHVWN